MVNAAAASAPASVAISSAASASRAWAESALSMRKSGIINRSSSAAGRGVVISVESDLAPARRRGTRIVGTGQPVGDSLDVPDRLIIEGGELMAVDVDQIGR